MNSEFACAALKVDGAAPALPAMDQDGAAFTVRCFLRSSRRLGIGVSVGLRSAYQSALAYPLGSLSAWAFPSESQLAYPSLSPPLGSRSVSRSLLRSVWLFRRSHSRSIGRRGRRSRSRRRRHRRSAGRSCGCSWGRGRRRRWTDRECGHQPCEFEAVESVTPVPKVPVPLAIA